MDFDFSSLPPELTAGSAIAGIIITVIVIICWWRIFHKAGKPGILAIIPFVNLWTYLKIATRNHLLWFILGIIPVTAWIAWLAGSFGLAKAFGKGFFMGLIIWLFPWLGLLILAFGRAKYQGIK